MQKTTILVLLVILCFAIPSTEAVSLDYSECVEKLNGAKLGLTNTQVYGACVDIINDGEAFIEDFRDRGLIIKSITLGETVSISLLFR